MRTDHDRASTRIAARSLLALATYWLPSVSLVSATARRVFGVRATVPEGGVTLTFDDGPHATGTPAMLEVLEKEGVPATFFLAGEQVERRPKLAADIVAAGHAVGVHCYRHRSLMRLTPGMVRADLDRAHAIIASATAREPRLYRPPYGMLTAPALLYARRNGWETVLWRRDGHDWEERATPDSIVDRMLRRLQDRDVLLLHDSDAYSAAGSWRRTAAALPQIIERIRLAGLELVSLS